MTGKKVKQILRKSGYKLSDVAESMGIIPQNLQSLLNVDDIKTGVLERIAQAIDESVFFFYKEDIKMPPDEEIRKKASEYANNFAEVYSKMHPGKIYPDGLGGQYEDDEEAIEDDLATRYLAMLEANTRTIENQQKSIIELTNLLRIKGGAESAKDVAPKEAHG